MTKGEIDEFFIRKMLGIADRSRILELLKLILDGDQKKSISLFKEMINDGIEPINFLNDLLENNTFYITKKKYWRF